jgi:integrase
LTAAAGNRFEALFVLALKTGMRRGELLALRWEDVDLDKRMLQVRSTLHRTREGLTFGFQRLQHPDARWCCHHPWWRLSGVTEHARKRSARGR